MIIVQTDIAYLKWRRRGIKIYRLDFPKSGGFETAKCNAMSKTEEITSSYQSTGDIHW